LEFSWTNASPTQGVNQPHFLSVEARSQAFKIRGETHSGPDNNEAEPSLMDRSETFGLMPMGGSNLPVRD
jgi:hypothetical protein